MQVYMVVEKGVNPLHGSASPDLFRNFSDIEASIVISWGKAANLEIHRRPTPHGPFEFHVKGIWSNKVDPELAGKPFECVLQAFRFPVWDSPTHL